MNELEHLKKKVEELEARLAFLLYSDRAVYSKNIQMQGGRNIQLSTVTGTQIATATDQLLAFYGITPVNQPDTVTDPSGGATVDSQARTAINAIIDRLQEIGLIA
jgi:hypothetical protein